MPKTLFEFYKSQGQALPSVAARAPLAAQHGITNYTGTAEQNNLLLSKLSAGAATPGNLPPIPPVVPSGPVDTGGAPAVPAGTGGVGDLGNLRLALRAALSEATQTQAGSRIKALSPLLEGGAAPNVITAALGLAQKGLAQTEESIFGDIMAGYRDATEARQKEIDRINELRAEYGSAVPSSVTDLTTALDLIAPTVDKERKTRLEKMASDQAEDNDIESWAESFARGELSIGNVPSKIRTAVKVRADAIKTKLEGEAKEEYKSRIAFRLEKKTSDFEIERALATQDENLTVQEQRGLIDYIDGLEAAQKASKKSGGKGFFSFLNQPASGTPQGQGGGSGGIFGSGNFSNISIDDRISRLEQSLGTGPAGTNKTYLEQTLLKNGYDPREIASRTRTGIIDKIFR